LKNGPSQYSLILSLNHHLLLWFAYLTASTVLYRVQAKLAVHFLKAHEFSEQHTSLRRAGVMEDGSIIGQYG